jgi:small neutral amino acid transporter SnatA (MarC family)
VKLLVVPLATPLARAWVTLSVIQLVTESVAQWVYVLVTLLASALVIEQGR